MCHTVYKFIILIYIFQFLIFFILIIFQNTKFSLRNKNIVKKIKIYI